MNDIDLAAGSGGPSARDDDTRDALPNVQKPSPAATSGGSEVLTSLSRRPKRNQVRLPDATTADYHHATPEQLLAGARRLVGKHFDEAALVEALRKSSDSPQARFQAFRDVVLDRALVLPTGAMKIVGHGGDHAVYTNIEGAPQNVVKISRFSISRFVTGGLLFGRTANTEMPQKLWDEARATARSEDEKYRVMAGYFPEGSMPPQTTRVELVALRGETLDLLRHRDVLPDPRRGWPQLDHSAIYHVPAMIRIQRLIPAAAERDNPHFSLSMRFLEGLDADESPRLYSVANDSWVLNRRGDFDKEAFKHVVHGTQLERLHELTESDPKLRENVRDFVARLIDYSNETRMLTDFGGDGNVVFDGASYHLIDAFYGMPNVFDDAERALGQIGRGEAISPQDRNKTFFSVNYIRALNAVAHALGIEKRVELVRSGKGHQEPNWDHVRSALRPPDPSVKKESSSGESAAVFFPVPFQPW